MRQVKRSDYIWLLRGIWEGNVVDVVPVKAEVQNRWLFRILQFYSTVCRTVHCYDMAPKTRHLDWSVCLANFFVQGVETVLPYVLCAMTLDLLKSSGVICHHHGLISQGLEAKGEDRDQGNVALVWQVFSLTKYWKTLKNCRCAHILASFNL